jgi:hypothetical protein
MTCPRCGSKELIFLKKEEQRTPSTFGHWWTHLECCECSLVFIEAEVHGSTPKVKDT